MPPMIPLLIFHPPVLSNKPDDVRCNPLGHIMHSPIPSNGIQALLDVLLGGLQDYSVNCGEWLPDEAAKLLIRQPVRIQ